MLLLQRHFCYRRETKPWDDDDDDDDDIITVQ